MPSTRITKVNIDKDEKAYIEALATVKGVSATKMLSMIILFYMQKNR